MLENNSRATQNTLASIDSLQRQVDEIIGRAPLSKIPDTFEARARHGYKNSTPVAGIIQLSAIEAQYILEYHNKSNRIITPTQLQKVRSSLDKYGWIFDGASFAFYTDGNVHDGQHRLVEASKLPKGKTIPVVMAWGCDTEAGQYCAKSKPRSQKEEIERQDKTVTSDEAAVVGDIAKRRKDRWELDTCWHYWLQWKDHARRGLQLTEELDSLERFSSQRKSLRAFAALASANGLEAHAIILFDLLQSEITGERSTRLGSTFLETWEHFGKDASQEPKLALLFKLLCCGLSQIRKSEAGDLALNYSVAGHNPMQTKLTGVS